MKVICTGNILSDSLLTPIHRQYFMGQFGTASAPQWRAKPGREYIVYGITIRRGYPFYLIERSSPVPRDWGFVPSICFETIDDRPSSLWRFQTGVIADHHGNQIFVTNFAIREWLEEPNFHLNLVDRGAREVEIMARAAAFMDAEFGV